MKIIMDNIYSKFNEKKPVNATWGCAAVIQNIHGKYLLGKRARGEGVGTWGFPGGSIEIGENPIDAIARETSEEVGLEVTELSPLSITNYDDKLDFAASYIHRSDEQPKIKKDEITETGWFTLEEIYSLDLFEYSKATLMSIQKRLDISLLYCEPSYAIWTGVENEGKV